MSLPKDVPSYLTEEAWGNATNTVDEPKLLELSPEERFRVLAWGAACPRPVTTWNAYEAMMPENPDAIPWLMNRYDTTNHKTRETWGRARTLNPGLYIQLTEHVKRTRNHPVGAYDEGMVPELHKKYMSGMSTLPGYAGSRVQIQRLGLGIVRPEHPRLTIDDLKYLSNDRIRDTAVETSTTPAELLATLANEAFKAHIDPVAILGHVLEEGKRVEENDDHLRQEVINALWRKSMNLWGIYTLATEVAPAGVAALEYWKEQGYKLGVGFPPRDETYKFLPG